VCLGGGWWVGGLQAGFAFEVVGKPAKLIGPAFESLRDD
jgi:hypothetical protein